MFARYVEVEAEDAPCAPAKRDVRRLDMLSMLCHLGIAKIWVRLEDSVVVDRTKVGKCNLAWCRGWSSTQNDDDHIGRLGSD